MEALTHELIHGYDYKLKRCDFSTCNGLAYSEVRAAREAECKNAYPFDFLNRWCIRRYAADATSVCELI